jgi:quinol monooxygenase YgiN
MELFFFAKFSVRRECEPAAEQALRNVLAPSRAEPGCLDIHAYRSTTDPRLFYIHSHWIDESAFDLHARLPHTVHFIEQMESLIDHPFDMTRTELIG